MKSTKTRTAYGPRRTRFDSASAERIDESVWIRPERRPVTITLPIISITAPDVTDDDLGLPDDPMAQRRAEFELRRAIAQRLADDAERRAARDRLFPGHTIYAAVPDDSLTLHRPTDALSPLEREIIAELERIATRPVPRWMLAGTAEKTALAS